MKSLSFSLARILFLSGVVGGLGVTTVAVASEVNVGVSVGVPLPRGYAEVSVGRNRSYYHRGTFYGQGRHGYHVIHAPRGGVVRDLHPRHTRLYFGSSLYYRYNNVYYQSCPEGYVVVEPPRTVVVQVPATVANATPATPKDSEYQSVWAGDVEYLFKDGQFFKRTSEGLVWAEAPLGAITKALPEDARSVWYQEIEYFECDDVCFRKTPDGYKVIEAPWRKAEPAASPSK